MRQVITIEKSGVVSGLQVKPGKGVNLQKLGRAQTTRASEIVWDEDEQAWKIDVLQDVGKGVVTLMRFASASAASPHHCLAVGNTNSGLLLLAPSYHPIEPGAGAWDKPLLFDNYDDAVKVEIAYLDALRLNGQF